MLVNLDNETLARLMSNQAAMDALMNMEGFRALNQDIETIVNKSEAVKKAKREANDGKLTENKSGNSPRRRMNTRASGSRFRKSSSSSRRVCRSLCI